MTTRVPGWWQAIGAPLRSVRPAHPYAAVAAPVQPTGKATRARRKTERQNRKRGRA